MRNVGVRTRLSFGSTWISLSDGNGPRKMRVSVVALRDADMVLKRILLLLSLTSGLPSAIAEPSTTGKPLTLAAAIVLTLQRNPELSSFSWDIRAAEARIIQSKLSLNPEITVEGENLTKTGGQGEGIQNTIQLSQLIELGGKKKSRVREAQFDLEGSQWEYQAKRLEVLKATSTAFVDVLAAQSSLQLKQDSLAIAEAAVPATRTRVDAGKAAAVELVRAQTAVASARIELEEAKRELQTARLNLAAQWGDKKASFPNVIGNLEQVREPPLLESLNAKLQHNPNLARWTTESEKRKATLSVARSEARPDITLQAGPRLIGTNPVEPTLVAGFSTPLPLWNRNQGKIAEAEANLGKVADERANAEARAYADLNEAYQTLAGSSHEARVLRETVLPGAKNTVDETARGYAAGRFSQLDVLEAQKNYNESRAQYVNALASYQKAEAQIDALTAGPVELPKPAKLGQGLIESQRRKAVRNE
jgi:cobalt-zinc-cadmium efflux system outer membrane protein